VKVLYVHSSADLYGSDRSLLRLVDGLRAEVEATVLVPCDGPLVAELEARGGKVVVGPLTVLRRGVRPAQLAVDAARSLSFVRGLVREVGPALVHSNTLAVVDGAVAARLSGIPHVYHAREFVVTPRGFRPLMAGVALVSSSSVIANSQAVAAWFAGDNAALRRRTTVVHNGRDYGQHPPREQGMATVAHPATFVVLARLNAWKGQDLAIDAVAALPLAVRRRLRLVLAGEAFPGNERIVEALRRRAREAGVAERVDFAGYVESETALASADVVLVPSTTPEPFGNALLEAMDVGLPIIATAHGGPLDVVVDGTTGILVPPAPKPLAAAIARLVDDPDLRARLGEAGYRRARARFTQERTLQGVLAVYRRITPGGGS